jgi:hypothetical protein
MSSPHPDNRNPTGIELTQEQRDRSFQESYWSHAIRYGIQYYVAGRFAAASAFTPVLANLLHHAVELLLKACLAYDDPVERIRKYGSSKDGYGHNLPLLWKEFKSRNAIAARPEFDRIIDALHRFEEIRYPEQLIDDGAIININIFAVDSQPLDERRAEHPAYSLSLPEVDELMGLLFISTRCNREVFLAEVNDERRRLYYDTLTTSLFGRENTKP